jgi:hypothetical protein
MLQVHLRRELLVRCLFYGPVRSGHQNIIRAIDSSKSQKLTKNSHQAEILLMSTWPVLCLSLDIKGVTLTSFPC